MDAGALSQSEGPSLTALGFSIHQVTQILLESMSAFSLHDTLWEEALQPQSTL